MHDAHIEDIKLAFSNIASDFDRAINQPTLPIDILPNRLELNGKIVSFKNESKYAKYIFTAITTAFKSEWYQSLGLNSQKCGQKSLRKFIPWLNEKVITHENRYTILKDYEAFRVNEDGVKPQSTGLCDVMNFLTNGVNSDQINDSTIQYIIRLRSYTTISVADERESSTLSSYFASMHWLREALGEVDYLKLESPKRLIDSFSISVATTLLLILQAKVEARKGLSDPITLKIVNTKIEINGKAVRNQHYCRNLLNHLGRLSVDGKPADILTELLLLDCVPADRQDKLISQWHESPDKFKFSYLHSESRQLLFTEPSIFTPTSWSYPSHIEQYLAAWLCAWQAIQPLDVCKLRRKDFVISKDHTTSIVALQCSYYKGRSRTVQEPPMLEARQIETLALIAYLEQLPSDNSNLFSKKIHISPDLGFSSFTVSGRLERLFKSPIITNKINQNLKKRQSSPLFLRAFIAMADHKEFSFNRWCKSRKLNALDTSAAAYRMDIKKPLPLLQFGLSAIKNSSIHARTDRYRDSDLINQNSHTSQTEKRSYLTDANMAWVNQNGRITRMVLNDMERYVYKPNLNKAITVAYDLILRTRVTGVLSNGIANHSSIKTNSLRHVNDSDLDAFGTNHDDIIVLDTQETVVNMLHYIGEAERLHRSLIMNNLPFFEHSVLPTVEWMENVIRERLNPSVVKLGQQTYNEIRTILPELFSNELHGGVG